MEIKKINLDNKSDLEFVEKLYIESFPPEERRSVLHMHRLMENEACFHVNVFIDKNETRIGFVNYWVFDTFIYLEHFAIQPEYRSAGHGRKALHSLIKTTTLPLVGEIELPDSSEFAMKRLKFYQRLDFKAWDIPYIQPPYEDGFEPIPMMLITFGDLDLGILYQSVVDQIYTKVYKYKS